MKGLILNLLRNIDKGIGHRSSSSVCPRWVHESFSVNIIIVIKLILSLFVMVASDFSVEISEDRFDWGSWSQWKSIRVI